MTYKIEQIEGIGPHYGERLSAVGIHTSDDLLRECGTDAQRRTIEARSGISLTLLSTWVHQADLMRVKGIGSEFGQLLEASGIEDVETLSIRKPENVVNLLDRVNREKRLTRAVPSLKTVRKWVQAAQQMVAGTATRPEMAAAAGPTAPAMRAATQSALPEPREASSPARHDPGRWLARPVHSS